MKSFIGKGGASSSLAKPKFKTNHEVQIPKRRKQKNFMKPTIFRMFYDRGDLPLQVSFMGATRKVTFFYK